MQNFYIIHLLGSLAYIAFGAIVLLKNRKARLHQFFGLIMVLLAVKSIALFFSGNANIKESLGSQAASVYFLADMIIPVLVFWFILIFTKRFHQVQIKVILAGTFLIALALLWFGHQKDYATVSYDIVSGYYAQWKQVFFLLFQFIYVFLTGLLSVILVVRFGLTNIDLRTRNSAKTVTVGIIIIFVALLQEQAQFLIYKEKVFADITNLLNILGSALIFYLLIKRGIIIFSSSLLSENILENLNNPVVLLDERGRIIYYNHAVREMTAMDSGQLSGKSVFRLLPSLNISLSDLMEYSKYGIHHIKTDLKDAFDNRTKIMISCQTIFSDSGAFQGIVCSFESITKKPVPQSLQKNHEDRMMMAFEASDKGFWDWDIQNGDLYFSEETYKMLGYAAEDLPNLSFTVWRSMLHPDDVDDYFRKLNENLKGMADSFSAEYRVEDKNGKWRWLLDRGRIVAYDEHRNPIRMSGMFTDITKVKEVEMQLRESQKQLQSTIKMKNRLIDFLFTDIREPFNGIIGLTEVLYMNPDIEDEERQQFLKKILDQSHRSFHLLENILDYAKLEDGGIGIKKRGFSLRELIGELHQEFIEPLTLKNITWKFDYGKDLNVVTDREILKRILRILIDNAIRLNAENAEMYLQVEKHDSSLVIKIRDNAVGIAQETLDRMFQMEDMGADAMRKSQSTHALGLMIARRLVETIGGEVTALATTGKGLEYYLEING